uniref:Mothers against decapentaplegic homolog n=1 Tax=Plectus sambesii TaxID=2011161 RepID=A0A914WU52_9BILA
MGAEQVPTARPNWRWADVAAAYVGRLVRRRRGVAGWLPTCRSSPLPLSACAAREAAAASRRVAPSSPTSLMPSCGLACMRSERKRQLDRLWRRRLLQTEEPRARRRFRRLMHGFDDEDLDALYRAVESDGRDARDCAPGPPMDVDQATCSKRGQDFGQTGAAAAAAANAAATLGDYNDYAQDLVTSATAADQSGLIPQIDKPMSLPYLCCKLWRWEELHVDAALHRLDPLPWCRFGRVTVNGATVSCCNPYHYALWTKYDLPAAVRDCVTDEASPPTMANGWLPHTSSNNNNINNNNNNANRRNNRFDDTSTHDTGFGDEITATAVEKTSPGGDDDRLAPTADAWARLARWEMKERIGDLISLVGRVVAVGQLAGSVFDAQNCQDDWDEQNEVGFALIRTPQAKSTTGDCEYDEVWLYNYGARPLFTCVSTTGSENSDAIRRVSPGYCILVHHIRTAGTPKITVPSSRGAVYLTISHGKGWGLNYHRLYVTECPCRFEVVFL